MWTSSLGNRKESHLAISGNFKQQEEVELYSQLPDYEDFRGYDFGTEDALNQVDRQIYTNFHKPACQALKHPLFSASTPQKLFREIKAISGNGKKAISNKNECLAE